LQRAAVEDGRRRSAPAAREVAQEKPQIVDHGLEHTGAGPAQRLLVNHPPRWEVVRQHPPRRAGTEQPLERVEHLAQLVAPLRRIFGQQGQVGTDERPFLGAHVGWMSLLTDRLHARDRGSPPVPDTL
jgi:hypothetical protein